METSKDSVCGSQGASCTRGEHKHILSPLVSQAEALSPLPLLKREHFHFRGNSRLLYQADLCQVQLW